MCLQYESRIRPNQHILTKYTLYNHFEGKRKTCARQVTHQENQSISLMTTVCALPTMFFNDWLVYCKYCVVNVHRLGDYELERRVRKQYLWKCTSKSPLPTPEKPSHPTIHSIVHVDVEPTELLLAVCQKTDMGRCKGYVWL